jgi:hypothetical protein
MILNQNLNYNAESNTYNSKLCYSSYLGEKDEKCYEDLLNALLKDSEFMEIFNEFKEKEKLIVEFESLDDENKCRILLKCFFIVLNILYKYS